MDWLKIGSLILLLAMLVMVWPAAKYWMKNSPRGSTRDWVGVIVPLALVIGFVVLLVKLA